MLVTYIRVPGANKTNTPQHPHPAERGYRCTTGVRMQREVQRRTRRGLDPSFTLRVRDSSFPQDRGTTTQNRTGSYPPRGTDCTKTNPPDGSVAADLCVLIRHQCHVESSRPRFYWPRSGRKNLHVSVGDGGLVNGQHVSG